MLVTFGSLMLLVAAYFVWFAANQTEGRNRQVGWALAVLLVIVSITVAVYWAYDAFMPGSYVSDF